MTSFRQELPPERERLKRRLREHPADVDGHVNQRGTSLAGVRALLREVMRTQAEIMARLDKIKG